MVIYECKVCNKKFKQKCHYKTHTENKKYPCYINLQLKLQDNLEVKNNDTIINLDKDKENKYNCSYCDKSFARSDSLNRHVEKYCKSKQKSDEFDILKVKYEELLKKYNSMIQSNVITNTNNNLVGNNNVNNTNNGSITIYQFGKEDYSKITNNDILKSIMSSTGVGIPVALIEKMHFNNEYPEFKNVCITDINRKYALLWNGKKWLRKKYENIGTEMLDRCLCLISDRMDELEKLVTDSKTFNIKKKTINRLEIVVSDDEDEPIKTKNENKNFRSHASSKIEESLYNNKDIVYKLIK
jgi:hypothetical protein